MQSLNLTAAFVVTQFFLLVIVFFGIAILRAGESRWSSLSENRRTVTRRDPFLLAGFALVTIGVLIFSEDVLFYSTPVFGGVEFPSISRSNAFLIVFSLDIVGAAALIRLTG